MIDDQSRQKDVITLGILACACRSCSCRILAETDLGIDKWYATCSRMVIMRVALKALKLVAVSWITLIVTASGVSGIVLCFGADGHFAFEMSHQGRCQDSGDAPGHGRHDVAEMLPSGSADCCGSCVDVSLSSDTMSQPMTEVKHSTSSTDELAGVFSAASFDTGIDVDLSLNVPRVPRCAPLRTSPSLLAQRTIILRV